MFDEERPVVGVRQRVRDESQVDQLVPPVDLVADDGVADVREMDANLVLASGRRRDVHPREWLTIPFQAFEDFDGGPGGGAVFPHAVLDRDLAALVPAERRIDDDLRIAEVTVDDGPVFLFDGRRSRHQIAELTRDGCAFRDEHDAARFAIEPIHQPSFGAAEVQTHPPDQARHLAIARRMADQSGWLVYHQQVVVFVNDL